jgi:diketogulonate reductase-like aldo/keto reductase
MATRTVSPDQQLQNISDALQETEIRLEQKGIDMYLMRTWLNQSLHYRAMSELYGRGELETIEFDEEDGDY